MEDIGNPFGKLKTVLTFDELIDLAFNKAMKIKPPVSRQDHLGKTKTFEINRINTAANVLVNNLENIVINFPSLNLVHPFYLELANIVSNVDELRKSLGRIHGVTEHIRNLEEEIKDKILDKNSKDEVKKLRKIAFARFSSMIKRIKSSLKYLKNSLSPLKNLPGFNPYHATVVMCGFPNTGKSSIIRQTTSGKPEIASYPFTTKKIIFGHRKLGFMTIQFVDTPGLLDRPIHERNLIEKQALAVFKHLADLLIFLFDTTINAEADLVEQISLFKEIKKFYPTSYFLPVISKVDLLSPEKVAEVKSVLVANEVTNHESEIWTVHTKSSEGMDKLITYIDRTIEGELLSNSKFRHVSSFEIADDQLTFDEMDDELFYS